MKTFLGLVFLGCLAFLSMGIGIATLLIRMAGEYAFPILVCAYLGLSLWFVVNHLRRPRRPRGRHGKGARA